MSEQLPDEIVIGDPAALEAEAKPEISRAEHMRRTMWHFAHELVKDIESPYQRAESYIDLARAEGPDSAAVQSAVNEIEHNLEKGPLGDVHEAELYRSLALAHGQESPFWKTAIDAAIDIEDPKSRAQQLVRVAAVNPDTAALDLARDNIAELADLAVRGQTAAAFVFECKVEAMKDIESPFWQEAARGVMLAPDPTHRAKLARDLAIDYNKLMDHQAQQ